MIKCWVKMLSLLSLDYLQDKHHLLFSIRAEYLSTQNIAFFYTINNLVLNIYLRVLYMENVSVYTYIHIYTKTHFLMVIT